MTSAEQTLPLQNKHVLLVLEAYRADNLLAEAYDFTTGQDFQCEDFLSSSLDLREGRTHG